MSRHTRFLRSLDELYDAGFIQGLKSVVPPNGGLLGKYERWAFHAGATDGERLRRTTIYMDRTTDAPIPREDEQ